MAEIPLIPPRKKTQSSSVLLDEYVLCCKVTITPSMKYFIFEREAISKTRVKCICIMLVAATSFRILFNERTNPLYKEEKRLLFLHLFLN